jgi:hypothetical protein
VSGFFAVSPNDDATALLSGPKVASAADHDRDAVQTWLNDMLGDERAVRVLAVTPVQAVTTSADEYGNVLPMWHASVLYRERLLPNGPENGDDAP